MAFKDILEKLSTAFSQEEGGMSFSEAGGFKAIGEGFGKATTGISAALGPIGAVASVATPIIGAIQQRKAQREERKRMRVLRKQQTHNEAVALNQRGADARASMPKFQAMPFGSGKQGFV